MALVASFLVALVAAQAIAALLVGLGALLARCLR